MDTTPHYTCSYGKLLQMWEYDHFTKECQNLQTEKEPEQIQQMYNLDCCIWYTTDYM